MRFLLAAAIVASLACIALPVVLIVGDALRKLWRDFRAPAKAERIVTESESDRQQRLASQPFAHTLDAGGAEYAVFRESLSPAQSAALNAHTNAFQARLQMQADADLLAMPGFGLRIPSQRDGSAS